MASCSRLQLTQLHSPALIGAGELKDMSTTSVVKPLADGWRFPTLHLYVGKPEHTGTEIVGVCIVSTEQ